MLRAVLVHLAVASPLLGQTAGNLVRITSKAGIPFSASASNISHGTLVRTAGSGLAAFGDDGEGLKGMLIAQWHDLATAELLSPQLAIPASPAPGSDAGNTLEDAKRLVRDGEFAKAEAALHRYLRAHDGSAPAHSMLAYALLRQGQPKDALAEYTRSAQIEPPRAEDLRNVADAYVVLNELADADKWMSLAVQKDPHDANAWYGLGRIRYSQQRFADAVECFRTTLVLTPRSAKAANNLGLSYEGLNRTEDAIAAYRQAIAWQELNPRGDSVRTAEQPMLNLAIALLHQGHPEEALPLLTRAASMSPRDPQIHEQMGHAYLAQAQLADAQREFEVATTLSPESAALHFLLGQVYRREGLTQQANAEFARSSALSGTHSAP